MSTDRMSRCPCRNSSATRCPPMNPPPPQTTILPSLISSRLSSSRTRKLAASRVNSSRYFRPSPSTRREPFAYRGEILPVRLGKKLFILLALAVFHVNRNWPGKSARLQHGSVFLVHASCAQRHALGRVTIPH